MPDYQPIDYRLRCHTKRTDLPADILRDIGEAYAEITRLQQERDEARREICESTAESADLYPREFAEKMGWDCYKEDSNV